jgi:hypothetical protein
VFLGVAVVGGGGVLVVRRSPRGGRMDILNENYLFSAHFKFSVVEQGKRKFNK